MLVEYYEPDKLFEEVVEYMPEMAKELVKIDAYLEDEKLFRMIKKDLSQRHPKTCQTGRNSTLVEVTLRMLVVKRLYGYSCEETERRVSTSLRLRQFCRVYLQDVLDDTTLIRWANQIQPQTLEQFNQRIIQLAVERKVTKGRKLRTDGTVVESNIRPTSDGLLADSVRVLTRTVQRARKLLSAAGQEVQAGFADLTHTAKGLARQIGETLRSKKEAAQAQGRQLYEVLPSMTEQIKVIFPNPAGAETKVDFPLNPAFNFETKCGLEMVSRRGVGIYSFVERRVLAT